MAVRVSSGVSAPSPMPNSADSAAAVVTPL